MTKPTISRRGPWIPRRPRPSTEPIPMAKLRQEIRRGLSKAQLRDYEKVLTAPALHLAPIRVKREDEIPLGASKLGGLPDLPPGRRWPQLSGTPLSFVAQIRLDDARATLPSPCPWRLPRSGMLSFFVDDLAQVPRAIVMHVTLRRLTRRPVPADFAAANPGRVPYKASGVRMTRTVTVPAANHPVVVETLENRYAEAYAEHVRIVRPPAHQLLGFRNHPYDDDNPEDFQLLLRLVSDELAGMRWGDDEALDFFIKESALKRGDFRRVFAYIGD